MTTDEIQVLYQAVAILREYVRTEIKDHEVILAFAGLIEELRLATDTIKSELRP